MLVILVETVRSVETRRILH